MNSHEAVEEFLMGARSAYFGDGVVYAVVAKLRTFVCRVNSLRYVFVHDYFKFDV